VTVYVYGRSHGIGDSPEGDPLANHFPVPYCEMVHRFTSSGIEPAKGPSSPTAAPASPCARMRKEGY